MGGLPTRACREGSRGRIRRFASPEDNPGASVNGERFDPLKIVQAFNRRGVEYVVIGGYAGELHAAAVPPTRDIDFTPRVTQENLGRLSQALTDLGGPDPHRGRTRRPSLLPRRCIPCRRWHLEPHLRVW